MNKQYGFTLIELVMVIVISSIIAVMASKGLLVAAQAYLGSRDAINANWQGEIALERMARDIRAVRSSSDISTASSSQFTFTDITGTSITFNLSGSSLMRNSQILADGVNSVTFSYFDSTGASTATLANIRYVTISLNITLNNANYTMATTIYPRNLI